ncbi:protein EI24 homolog [Prosopis cineraria]|uniref:protein EI24 homolog n=1 Tax=Prosopis cineraria TaxID=364024 RepID=UPI00241074C7|nr:protein EI24 homolog [Prosopis cineraria]XP_054799999.1 protein EI24 homolog [Prosopis cineraria]XP_054800000.1 protein EI24 homolog [Prosopis cineraria]
MHKQKKEYLRRGSLSLSLSLSRSSMEATESLVSTTTAKLKLAALQWLEGFKEACCLHRVVILCFRSRKLLVRTGQCFLLNGFIFLGSLSILNSVVIPTLQWILPDRCSQFGSHKLCNFGGTLKFYSFLRLGLIHFFYVFWFYPLYVFSIVLSAIWYNDIAKYGYDAVGRSKSTVEESSSHTKSSEKANSSNTKRLSGLGGVIIGAGEQVYSILLLSVFFLKVYATGFIPLIGKVLNFLLLSWLYAYYCFEYKWSFNEVALDKRLDYFQSSWAFFSGFGSPCVFAIFFFSPLVSYGIMAILFPLFVLTAAGSKVDQEILLEKSKWRGVRVGRLPIFYISDKLLIWMLSRLPFGKKDRTRDNKAR